MQPRAGHAAARRLARVVAPAAFDARAVLVGEMAFDVQHVAERAGGNDVLELEHGGEGALAVAEAEHHAGAPAGGNRALGFGKRERQRLFAPHRLAGLRHRDHLVDVKRVGRRQHHRAHARIGDHIVELRRQFEAVLRRKRRHGVGLLAHAVHETQPRALALHRVDDRLAPAAEPDDGSLDHVPTPRCEAAGCATRRRMSSTITVESKSPSPWRRQLSSKVAATSQPGSC